MDFQDVSSLDQYVLLQQHCQQNAARAAGRKGEQPRDHPPPWLLINIFMSRLQATDVKLSQLTQSATQLATSQVPAPYTPCTFSAADLKPMTISQMKLETHHRGRKIVVRVLTPPDRMTAVMAIVEDGEGVAVLLQLYNQPDEAVVPKGSILQEGGFVLIKEPFFKAVVTDGSYSIRVDHVSDVIFLDEASELVPKKWRKRDGGSVSSTTSREICL